jgi:hypothetical protein
MHQYKAETLRVIFNIVHCFNPFKQLILLQIFLKVRTKDSKVSERYDFREVIRVK